MSDHLDVIEQFKRLSPDVQADLAERFNLTDVSTSSPNMWLLRAREKGVLAELGKAVQEAS